jgi:RND family efflux transporter MFP subunit
MVVSELLIDGDVEMLLRSVPMLCLAFAVGCGRTTPEGGPGGAGAMPPADVKMVTLSPKPVPRTSEFVASIRSLASTTVQPQVEGIVTRVLVRSGDRVRAGQPLVQIDPDKQQASVSSLEANRAARQADVAYATQQLGRLQKLFEAGAVSQQELEQAQTAADTAKAQLQATEAGIRESRVELGYYRVGAPAAGIVGDVPVRTGDRVTNSTVITTIDSPQGLEAYVSVPLERAADLRLGLPLQLVDDTGTVVAENPVTFVAPRADDATQSVLVKAQLRHQPPALRVMQYARARIVWSNDPALTIPVVAVNRLGGQYFVYVAESAGSGLVARQKPISVGEIVGDDYIVQNGLKAGEQIIVSNLQKIGDGAPVRAVSSDAPGAPAPAPAPAS